MGLIETKKNTHGGGMGFLLVFFPDHHNNDTTTTTSSSSPSSPATISPLFRSRSSRLLLSKAQSTISICILLLFLTLFLFTLSTFEPSPVSSSPHRRFLLNRDVSRPRRPRFALQGMGTLFLRGTKSMHDLIVAHLVSDTTPEDLRLFLRLLHRSGATSKSDVILLFDSPSSTSRFTQLIEEENDSFLKLVRRESQDPNPKLDSVWGFNHTRFFKKQSTTAKSEPIWGKRKSHKVTNNQTDSSISNSTELTTELIHGSVLGFDVTELDPENSLSGFMDHVPMSLRRWASYPMLLGRVRRSFKHVLLVDVKTSLILGDPLTRIRNRSPESILLFPKHSNKKISSEINPAVLIGGAKGIRKLASLMHTEIVRATMTMAKNKKKKNSVAESVMLSQLVKNLEEVVTMSEEMIAEASSLTELRTKNSVATTSFKSQDVIQRGNVNVNSIIMKRICLDSSSVYNYC